MTTKQRKYKVTYNADGTVTILDRSNGQSKTYSSGAFNHGQSRYMGETDEYPGYVHFYVDSLCKLNKGLEIHELATSMAVYGYNDQI